MAKIASSAIAAAPVSSFFIIFLRRGPPEAVNTKSAYLFRGAAHRAAISWLGLEPDAEARNPDADERPVPVAIAVVVTRIVVIVIRRVPSRVIAGRQGAA